MKIGLLGCPLVGLGMRAEIWRFTEPFLFFVNCISRAVKLYLSNLVKCVSQMRVGWVVLGRHAGG